MGGIDATVDVSGALYAKGRGGDDEAAVTRRVDGVGVFKSTDEVGTIRIRVSDSDGVGHPFANLRVLVAWSGHRGDDAGGETGVSLSSVVGIILVEADAELLDGGSAATVIPIVSFRVDDALDVGEVAAVIWIG